MTFRDRLAALRPGPAATIALWLIATVLLFLLVPNGAEKRFAFAFGSLLYLLALPLGLVRPAAILPWRAEPRRWQAGITCGALAAYTGLLALLSR